MEIFTDELSETVKSEYVHKIFKGMNDEEIFKAVQLLEIYYDEEGSADVSGSGALGRPHGGSTVHPQKHPAEPSEADPGQDRVRSPVHTPFVSVL